MRTPFLGAEDIPNLRERIVRRLGDLTVASRDTTSFKGHSGRAPARRRLTSVAVP